ncbi:MAG: hypothetical protein V1688_04770 [bacterium]
MLSTRTRTDNASHKKILALSIIALIIMIWIIFSAIYIINDKWKDFQLSQMQQSYQKGVADSVRALMTESAKCDKIPLYYGGQTVEVVAVSCLQKQDENKSQTSAAKPAAAEKPNEPAAEQPAAIGNQNEPAIEQPQMNGNINAPTAEQPQPPVNKKQ